MKLPDLIPPPDLLDKIDGVEEGLRKRRRLGALGIIGALASLTQILYNSKWLEGLANFQWRMILHDWPTLLAVLLFALFVLLFTWAKFWIRESRRPFRYTYYIGEFRPVDEQAREPSMTYLPVDLSERLSKRITRLSRFDERTASKEATAQRTSHLHVEGDYLVRRVPADGGERWVLEVMPWVRVGKTDNRETLALTVRFPLVRADESSAQSSEVADRGEARADDGTARPDDGRPRLLPEHYGLLVERVYYSIATQVYKQIRTDVRRKIDLLPTRYFRAMAYYNEARDYARSNTLDAYEAARELFDDAIAMYDPHWRPEPQGALRRGMLIGRKFVFWLTPNLRRLASRAFPTLSRVNVMMARARIGYADMVLYRHVLAGMAGLSMSPIFEARPVADMAVGNLKQLPPDVPDRSDTLFDAFVTLATAYFYLGSTGRSDPDPADSDEDVGQRDDSQDAASYLNRARELDPARAERDPKYLFVWGKLQPRTQWELRLLRRAVELDPKFEVAQFELALRSELHWRGQARLERGTANLVVREYQSVLAINPGNISALARLGDLYWLLALPAHRRSPMGQPNYRLMSRSQFLRGREYKEVRQDTFIAELDYGLARLAAEAGRFNEAYDFYSSAVSAHVAYGVEHARGGYTAQFHFFDRINDEILQRYRRYVRRVANCVALAATLDRSGRNQRIRDAVYGYALNDYGEACFRYWMRYGGERQLAEARNAFQRAWVLSGRELVFPAYNLHLLELHDNQFAPAIEWVDRVQRVEPQWPDGRLARRAAYTEWARRARNRRNELRARLGPKQRELEDLQRRREDWQRPLKAEPGLAGAAALGDQSAAVNVEVQALPLPLSSQSDTALRRLDERIRLVHARIADLQEQIENQEAFLCKAEQEAGKTARYDVPHEWLAWLWDAPPSIRRLKQVDREGNRARRRWERELDDVHVRVLINWAVVKWALAKGETGAARDSEAQKISQFLLERLQRHFWRDDLDVLVALREMMAGADRPEIMQDCNRRIRAAILRACEDDPQYAMVAWAMSDRAFTIDDRLKMLDRLATTSKLSSGAWARLLVQAFTVADPLGGESAAKAFERLDQGAQLTAADWRMIGQSLVAAARPELGWLAYERAIGRSDDPEFLRQLGDELSVPPTPQWELSLQAFQKGIERVQEGEQVAAPG
jgi:hypothetical protein